MDNFDKNQVDSNLMDKVDEILTGKVKYEEPPELVFSEEVPKDYDISIDLNQGMNASLEAASATTSGDFKPEVEKPDAGFNYSAPEAPEFSGFVKPEGDDQQGTWTAPEQNAWNGTVPQGGETWQDLKNQRKPQKQSVFNSSTKAWIGFIIGVLAVAVSVITKFGFALGALPLILGLYFSKAGLNSDKRQIAMIGLILNVIGVVLFLIAAVKGFSL